MTMQEQIEQGQLNTQSAIIVLSERQQALSDRLAIVEDDRQTANYKAVKVQNTNRLLNKGLIAKAIKTNGGF